jgi:hypothetical protein
MPLFDWLFRLLVMCPMLWGAIYALSCEFVVLQCF